MLLPRTLHSSCQLVNQLLERPGNTIIAGVRDPSQAKDLASLGPNVVVTQLDVSDEASIEAWAASLKKDFAHIDVSWGLVGRGDDRAAVVPVADWVREQS